VHVRGAGPGQFHVRGVADGHQEVIRGDDVGDPVRSGPGQAQAVAARGGGGGVHALGRVRAAGGDGDGARLPPRGRGELGPGGVGGADEDHARGDDDGGPRQDAVERPGDQAHVTTAPVRLGAGPRDDPGVLQHVEVMGEEVGPDAEGGREVARGAVAEHQGVDDGEAGRIGEGAEDADPAVAP